MDVRMFHEFSTIFTSQKNLYRYLYGGHAIVTLYSPSGVSHMYSYERPRDESAFPEDSFFVYALHLADGHYKKFYLGMIEEDRFRMTRNSRFNKYSEVMKGAFYIENMRKSQSFLNKSPMVICHEGVCSVCGGKISSDRSRKIGMGMKCRNNFELPEFNPSF